VEGKSPGSSRGEPGSRLVRQCRKSALLVAFPDLTTRSACHTLTPGIGRASPAPPFPGDHCGSPPNAPPPGAGRTQAEVKDTPRSAARSFGAVCARSRQPAAAPTFSSPHLAVDRELPRRDLRPRRPFAAYPDSSGFDLASSHSESMHDRLALIGAPGMSRPIESPTDPGPHSRMSRSTWVTFTTPELTRNTATTSSASDDCPRPARTYALNGNHEMYSGVRIL